VQVRPFEAPRGRAPWTTKPGRSKPVCRADPNGGRSPRSTRHADTGVTPCRFGGRPKPFLLTDALSQVTARTRAARDELHRIPSRGRGFGASSKRWLQPKPEQPLRRSPSRMNPTEVELARKGLSRSGLVAGLAEAGPALGRSPESCLPPAIHRGGARVQDTQRGISTTPPLGFGPLRRFEPRRSLCRFASPAPSALRVSHPLSGLIPPGPRGSVSRHFRPWGLLTAFRAFPTRPAVAPLDARCSLAVSAGFRPCRASSTRASAPAFHRALLASLSPFAASVTHRAARTACLGISSVIEPPK
jgi:hypothetical protein